jgi:cytochrome c oxidase assembly protein subunit 15
MQIAKCKLQNDDCSTVMSRWPHRWAVLLACATFPLVWVGGLVTTTDSGMAVPDWPNTYGYNLFLYPWQEWILGPWALFLEHSHRLIGATVGLITIALVAVVWRTDSRRWLHWFSVAVLAMVIFQGVLGGMRVLFDERTLAMLHGCTGPLFFGLTVAMVVFTSRSWQCGEPARNVVTGASQVWILATVTCVLAYLQILLGAVLRHVPVATEPMTFVLAVRFHLVMAAILSLHALVLVWTVLSRASHVKPLRRLATTLAGLLILQLMLGAGTWLVKFSVPTWVPSWVSIGTTAVQYGGWLQTHVITAHVAAGSLLFVTTLALALYSVRLLSLPARTHAAAIRLEAAV